MSTSRRDEALNASAKHRHVSRFPAGWWYYVITVCSVGLLAWVPFLHAMSRVGRRPEYVRRATLYGIAAAALTLLMAATPLDRQGNPVGTVGQVLSTVGGMALLTVVVLGCVQLTKLRREVYGKPASAPASETDPAVAEVLAARRRRDQARALAGADPLMARELRIGRPDLARNYDDGGLVDLNQAPAQAIEKVCGIDRAIADSIVAARESRGGFLAVDDVFTAADVPISQWDVIRDRAIVIAP